MLDDEVLVLEEELVCLPSSVKDDCPLLLEPCLMALDWIVSSEYKAAVWSVLISSLRLCIIIQLVIRRAGSDFESFVSRASCFRFVMSLGPAVSESARQDFSGVPGQLQASSMV